jgi:hypothetical protein
MNTFSYKEYWDNRYVNGGSSGQGSYSVSAELKGNYINNVIKKYDIKKINDFGHGDGNQLTYINGYEDYTGYDVSQFVRKICRDKFKTDEKIHFIDYMFMFTESDMNFSFDVLYHIIDENEYYEYVDKLFTNTKFVLIYSTNENMDYIDNKVSQHILHRKFTDYVSEKHSQFKLIDVSDGMHDAVKFFLYQFDGDTT